MFRPTEMETCLGVNSDLFTTVAEKRKNMIENGIKASWDEPRRRGRGRVGWADQLEVGNGGKELSTVVECFVLIGRRTFKTKSLQHILSK